jgi:hypothetical protein
MSTQSASQIALPVAWLVATMAYVIMLYGGVRNTRDFATLRNGLTIAYAAVLVWYLACSGPSTSQLLEFPPLVFANWQFGRLAAVLVSALLFCLPMVSDKGWPILFLLFLVSTLLILVAWHRQITSSSVALGIAVSLIAFVAGGILFWVNEFVPKPNLIIFLLFVPPMFIVGSLLMARTGLGRIRLLEGQYGNVLISFLWGCLLFIPLGLANAADKREAYSWVNRWWQPLVMPLWSGINEEVMFRLFLVPLCYALLRPAFNWDLSLAIITAVLFSGITFGLGHGRTWSHFWSTGLCYGLPMAIVFASRDWEHAVGAHYMVNMIPWAMVFLKK